MKLVKISLLGNRITGLLPKEIANITTLEELLLEYNQLSGTIPPEFGDLPSIKRLLFSSNNLTGELHPNLAKLTNLTDFRISDNNFTGSIPNFIQDWTNIEKLVIQASGLTGPIPSGITALPKLTDLRISDLNGNESTFPSLSKRNWNTLILRRCNIVGELPSDIGGLSISETFYLTGNSLTGPLRSWMQKGRGYIDLSYNNLSSESIPANCRSDRLNLFASTKGNTSHFFTCLRRQCPQYHNSLHINCGGAEEVDDDRSIYQSDIDTGGPSELYKQGGTKWGFSSTGQFLDDMNRSMIFSQGNHYSISGKNSVLYKDARLSPLSLTYYDTCLRNGSYRVNLHFVEIMFTDDTTYYSLGRRIFDVYIQGVRVLKDFNIENKAGGVNRAVIESFTTDVTDNTLEIRFYWAGKGTNGIPIRGKGAYGPLISAISVNPENGNSLSAGAIVGIVMAVLSTVLLVLGILWWKLCQRHKDSLQHDLKGLDLRTGSFTLRQIKAATNNFDPSNKIGEGGFGPVYKGVLLDGTIIAVKQLSSKSKQGNREFVNEIGMISGLQHPHLVKLYGCCVEGNQLLLVYEYLENNSLARGLFGPKDHQLHLDWQTRHKICIGIARGLAYLHEESRLKIVHRDIKPTNVLLDRNLVPKISDFGLAKLHEEDNTHISTRVAGTFGYMAPEYAMRGYLTEKADVYSFGVVLLEVVSGRSNTSIRPREESFYLLDWANSLKAKGNLLELVDPRLESDFNEEEVMTAINVSLLCTNAVAAERPRMSAVVSMLMGRAGVAEFVSDSSEIDKINPNEMAMAACDDQDQSISMDVPLTDSSASTSDLYPINLDTDYWERRYQ